MVIESIENALPSIPIMFKQNNSRLSESFELWYLQPGVGGGGGGSVIFSYIIVIVADSQHSRTHLSPFARCTLGLSRHSPAIFIKIYCAITACMTHGFAS